MATDGHGSGRKRTDANGFLLQGEGKGEGERWTVSRSHSLLTPTRGVGGYRCAKQISNAGLAIKKLFFVKKVSLFDQRVYV